MDRTQLRNAYEAIEEAYGLLPVPDDREFEKVLDALEGYDDTDGVSADGARGDYRVAYYILLAVYEALAFAHDFEQRYG